MPDPKVAYIKVEDVQRVSKALMDSGSPIEAGFRTFLAATASSPAMVTEEWMQECRNLFFAGAKYLFDLQMYGLEEGTEPTQADLRRMSDINRELDAHETRFKQRFGH